jgi:hypothetical protein
MTQGGGFCELHGPYDPPHQSCPFCAAEAERRRVYGPSQQTTRTIDNRTPDEPGDFVRQTFESDVPSGVTEIVSRPVFDPDAPLDDDLNEPPILAWLVVKEPRDRRGTIVQVQANQSIGREGDIRWNDPGLSRQHARLTLEPPEDDPDGFPVFHLWPFGPTNPVYINGRQIRGATPLHENDEIRLGDTLFVFKMLTD